MLAAKSGFLMSVYATLVAQLAVTFAVRHRLSPVAIRKWMFLASAAATLGLVVVLSAVPMPAWCKLLVFTALSVALGTVLHLGTALMSPAAIERALLGAIGVFVAMSVVAVGAAAAGVDLRGMAGYLTAALVGLLVARLVLWLWRGKEAEKEATLRRWLLVVGLVLFSLFITKETNAMLQKDYSDDFVGAAVDLYLSFVNVFTNLAGLQEQ